jgi:hypothetical protein
VNESSANRLLSLWWLIEDKHGIDTASKKMVGIASNLLCERRERKYTKRITTTVVNINEMRVASQFVLNNLKNIASQ